MKKLYLAMAGIAAFLVGCSSEEPTVMTDKNQSKDRNPYHVGLNEALSKVGPVMKILDGPTKTFLISGLF